VLVPSLWFELFGVFDLIFLVTEWHNPFFCNPDENKLLKVLNLPLHTLMSKMKLPFLSSLTSNLHLQINSSLWIQGKSMYFLRSPLNFNLVVWWYLHQFMSSLSLLISSMDVLRCARFSNWGHFVINIATRIMCVVCCALLFVYKLS
jgi:hypothetical protein